MSDDRLYRPPGWTDAQLTGAPFLPDTAAALGCSMQPVPTASALRIHPRHEACPQQPGKQCPNWNPADNHRCNTCQDRPPYVRVYRTAADPETGLAACWHWRCDTCGEQSNGCAHTVLHHVGSWAAAMCGGFHHVHTRHPRPAPDGAAAHTVLLGRRRCDWSPPDERARWHASWVLVGRIMMPRDWPAREIAREVLALAGVRSEDTMTTTEEQRGDQ